MCQRAIQLVGVEFEDEQQCYRQMYLEAQRDYLYLKEWWHAVLDNDAEAVAIDSAARCLALDQPLPSLSPRQTAMLALRLRLGSRVLRALARAEKSTHLARRLARMSVSDQLQYVLIELWPVIGEIFDESLDWEVEASASAGRE